MGFWELFPVCERAIASAASTDSTFESSTRMPKFTEGAR